MKGGAKVLWTVDVGHGCGNAAIREGRLYIMGRDCKTLDFTVRCLEAIAGTPICMSALRVSGEPQSTLTTDGNWVDGLSKGGGLFCLRAADGTPARQKHLEDDFKTASR